MACPYLAQVTMVFCQASPAKKLIPSDRITTASSCEADERWRECPLYRESLDRALQVIEEHEEELHPAGPKGGTP